MCLLIGLAWKFASHEWSPVFAFNLLWTSTLANLLCQLFIKYECKQTNPLGSNWKVFACFIELCLLSIFLMLVYSVLLRFWGSSLEHFFFSPPPFCSSVWEHKGEYRGTVIKEIDFLFLVSKEAELRISCKHAVWAALCFLPLQALTEDPRTLYLTMLSRLLPWDAWVRINELRPWDLCVIKRKSRQV